jgi:D-arginine dehydrogenase
MNAVDFAIIGGGIAGVSVAAALAGHGSVVVLEQEPELAFHSTGRSMAALLRSYGNSQVRALTALSRSIIDNIGAELGFSLLRQRPHLWIARESQADRLDALVRQVHTLEAVDADGATSLCPALRPGYVHAAAVETDAADIDVMALHQFYLKTAAAAGAVVMKDSPVRRGERRPGGWVLDTPAETISAGKIVNAAGAWADDVAVCLGGSRLGLRPKRRTLAVARSSSVDSGWPLVVDADEEFYFRPHAGGVVISPADETDQLPGDATPDPLDIALALERVNAATSLELTSIITAWAGLRTFAPDRSPIVGPDPSVEDVVWLAGLGGFGIQTSPALGPLAACIVRGVRLPPEFAESGVDVDALSPGRIDPTTG